MLATIDQVPVWRGRMEKFGKPAIYETKEFLDYKLGLEGREIEFIVREHLAGRTVSQNEYYWGVIVRMLAEHSGVDTSEAHEIIKRALLCERGDPALPFLRSTRPMNVREFSIYIEAAIRLLQGWGLIVPNPESIVRVDWSYR